MIRNERKSGEKREKMMIKIRGKRERGGDAEKNRDVFGFSRRGSRSKNVKMNFGAKKTNFYIKY